MRRGVRRHSRPVIVLLVAALAVVVAGGAGLLGSRRPGGVPGAASRSRAGGRPAAAAGRGRAASTVRGGPAPVLTGVVPSTGWIATLRGPLGWSASPGGPAAGTLPGTNPFGTRMVLAIVGVPGADGWAKVELPIRPNGSTGWIRWRRVQLYRTTYRVEVHLRSHLLVVLDGSRVVLTSAVAVGTSRTPTPTGSTYLWELVRPEDPNGPYGPYIFGLALYSDAYDTFNGGEAQIGIHGNDEPSSIGHDASNGCIRLPNAVIQALTTRLPLGTPVSITS